MILLQILLCLWSEPVLTTSSPEMVTTSYIEQYRDLAVVEMHRSGVPASITLAQAIIETNSGQSDLATKANNHFGIKCKRTWNGDTYYHKDDDLDSSGKLVPSCFRAYDTVIDSYADHSNFLRTKENYIALFLLDRKDYKNWAWGLKNSGYATNPNYAKMIIRIIEKYNLNIYDHSPNPVK